MNQLPVEWQVKRLDEVSKVINGGTPKTKVKKFWGGPHFWITPAEMGKRKSPYVSETKRTLTDAGLQKSSAQPVPPLSIIMSTRAPIGHLVINDKSMAFNQGCRALVPNDSLDYKYLFYFLWSSVELLNELGTGATFKELSAGKLKGVQIPLPPLPEQKHIVAILDEAFAGISQAVANAEKNLANARELFESYLNNVFTRKGEGWAENTINEVTSVINGYAFKSGDFSEKNSIKSIKITNVGVQEFIADNSNMLPIEFLELYKKVKVKEGDIAVALTRSIISRGLKVAVIPAEFDGALLNQRVAGLVPDSKIVLGQYLFFYLCSSGVFDYVKKNVNTLMQPNLSINDLKKLIVPVPSIVKQQEIVKQLEVLRSEIQCLESIYQQKLTALTELKQSLLQKAFAGELTTDSQTITKEGANI